MVRGCLFTLYRYIILHTKKENHTISLMLTPSDFVNPNVFVHANSLVIMWFFEGSLLWSLRLITWATQIGLMFRRQHTLWEMLTSRHFHSYYRIKLIKPLLLPLIDHLQVNILPYRERNKPILRKLQIYVLRNLSNWRYIELEDTT